MFEGISRVAKRPDHSLFDILAEALPTTRKTRRSMAVWLGFWSRSIAEAKVAEQQIAFHHRWHSMVKEQLEHHFKLKKKNKPADIDDIAEGITAQINGLIIRGLVDSSKWPKARQHKALKNYLAALGLSR